MAVSLAKDSQADVDGDVDQGATIVAGRRDLVTLGLSEGSNAGIDGDVNQPVSSALLLALNLSKDGSAETNRNADQGATIVAGRRDLVTLGLSKGSNAGIDGHVNQPVGGALLLALSLSEDGSAEVNRNADQAVGGVGTLYKSPSALYTL